MNDEFQRVIREGLNVLEQAKKMLAQKKWKWQALSSPQEGARAFQGKADGGWTLTVGGPDERRCVGMVGHEHQITVLHGDDAGVFFKAAVMATASPKRT